MCRTNWLFLIFVLGSVDSQNNGTTDTKDLTAAPINPKLNLIKSFEEIPVNSTFEVECVGNRPLNWIVRERFNGLGGDINVTDFYDADAKDFPYSSKLTVFNAQYTDTTMYTCNYSDPQLDTSEYAASIYLYVNDEEELLTPVYQFLESTPSRELVIPCRPTFSRANVTLWKSEGQDEMMVNLEEGHVSFDPQIGFTIRSPHTYYSGAFYCRAVLGDKKSERFILLEFSPSLIDITEPIIEETDTEHAKIESTFTLNCYIDIELGGMVFLTWRYPGEDKSNTTGKYLVEKPKGDNIELPTSKMKVKRVHSRITIKDAQKVDEGFYTCAIRKNLHETKSSIFVKVRGDELNPYVNITKKPKKKYLTTKEKTDLKLVYEFISSFVKRDLDVAFFKDGQQLSQSKRVNITYNSRHNNGSTTHVAILVVKSVRRTDSGNYTIEVRNGDYVAIETIPVYIEAPPIADIIINNEIELYNYKQNYTLICVVDGFPNVNVEWKWRKCDDYECQNNEWSDMNSISSWGNEDKVKDVNTTLIYQPRRSLEVTALRSGEYACLGSNSLSSDDKKTKFTVTDVEGGFGITSPESGTIIEGDNVILTCKAHIFIFSNISWYIMNSNEEQVPLSASRNEWQISNENTTYSLMSTINVTDIKFNETIICVGKRFDELPLDKVYRTLIVKNATQPQFLSNQTAKLEIKTGRSGFLNCTSSGVPQPSVTWFKDGQPLMKNTNVMRRSNNDQVLYITVALKASVHGTYKCVVRNRVGELQRTFNVFVEEDDSMPTETIALAIVLPIIIIMFLVVGFCWVRRIHKEREEKAELKALSQELFNKGEIELLNPDMPLDDQVELLPYDHRWEFPKERLKMGRILGQGAFGRVVKAEAIGLEDEGSTTVAVKMLKERADKTQRKALVAELKILIHLGKNLNIVNLLGAVTKNMMKGELLVMVEFCRYGNLRNYLLKRKNRFVNQLDPETGQVDPALSVLPGSPIRVQLAANQGLSNPIYGQKVNYADLMHENNSGNSYNVSVAPNSPDTTGGKSGPFRWFSINEEDDLCQPVTTTDLLCYAFQVARGMQYLSSRRLLHRDLAARNVLLADDNVVKICDFGLAKDCYNYDTYRIQGNGPLPIKWMALESLSDKVYTIKSDVWSFGILLWEFFTLGGDPYPGVDLDEEFFKRLKGGYRMEKPDYAPNNVYRIMLQCWNSEPEERPDFETLGDIFGDFLHASVKEFYVDLNNQYADMNSLRQPTDYLAMSQSNYLTMNQDEDKGPTVHYDNVNSVRPVDNGPVPLDPMLAVPMIQLEPINVHKKKNKGRPAPDTPDANDDNAKRETDYLMMDNAIGDIKSFSRQRKGNESLRSDASSGFHSDLDTSAETSAPPSYNLVMEEERIGIEVL